MKNTLFYRHLARFIRDESGVYAIIMALTGIFLLVAISFAFELSGMLMDKARLSDSLEQAALTLTAENNNFRTQTKLPSESQIDSRNKNIVNAYVAQYLPRHTDPEFTPKCDREGNEGIACLVTGKVQRHTWFPISVGTADQREDIVPERAKVGNYGMAVKSVEQVPSKYLDVMIAVNMDAGLESVSPYSVSGLPHQCYRYNYGRSNSKYANWFKNNCTIKKGRVAEGYDLSNYSPDAIFYEYQDLEDALGAFTIALFDKEQARSQTTRVSFFPFAYGAQVRTPNLEKRCLIPFKRRTNAAFLEAFEERKRKNPYIAFGKYDPDSNPTTKSTKLYVRKLPGVHSVDYTEKRLRSALNSISAGVSVSGGGDRTHSEDIEYVSIIYPMYVDVDETIKYVKTMNPYQLSDQDFPASPSYLDEFVCFETLDKNEDGEAYRKDHRTVKTGDGLNAQENANMGYSSSIYKASSRWYGAKERRNFDIFVKSRLRIGPGYTNIASGLINATLQFLALGRNPEAKRNQLPTQRVLFVILTGNDMGNFSIDTYVRSNEAFCYPTEYRVFYFDESKQTINDGRAEWNQYNNKCTDKVPAGIIPMKAWLDKSLYARGDGTYKYSTNMYGGLYKMVNEIVGKRQAGAEDDFDFNTGTSPYPDARSSALCLNIRQRLDGIDGKDAGGSADSDQPNAKIYFFIFGNKGTRSYMTKNLAAALLSCMPTQYAGTSDQEKYVMEVKNGNDLYQKMLSVLATEGEIEDGTNLEEVGFSRTPRR